MADVQNTADADPRPPRFCSCGCGDVVKSKKPTARYLRGHSSKGQFASPVDRFWASVRKGDGCWTWMGATKNREGYGSLYVSGRNLLAHRFSYSLHFDLIPPGQCVCHRCDNPACVNPAHLFLGTHKDNSVDRVSKRRQAKGESSGRSKLLERDVLAIRDGKVEGQTAKEMARRFGVSIDTVFKILAGNRWRHLGRD